MRQFLSGVGFLSRSQTLTSWIPAQPQRILSTTTEPPVAPPHTGQILFTLENTVLRLAGLNGCKGVERAPSSSNIHCFRQCCGSALVSTRIWIGIRIQHFLSLRIRIQIQGFDDQNLEKICSWKIIYISSNFKTWIFFTFVGHFSPPRSGSVFPMRILIRLQLTKIIADPDPQQRWFSVSVAIPSPAPLIFNSRTYPDQKHWINIPVFINFFFRSHEKES